MNIIDGALIIAISLILNGVLTLLLAKYIIIKSGIQPYIRMGKQFASSMGTKSQEVQHQRRQKAMNTETKKKIAEAAIDELPMGGVLKRIMERAGISGEEIFSLMQDADFVKGIQVIISTFTGVIDKVKGKGGEEKQAENQQFGLGKPY